MSLSDSFIQSILEKVNSPDVIGVGIVGSYARGQESKYSDVDVDIYVNKMPENEYEQFTAHYWNGKLVSFSHTVLEEERAALTDPKRAI